MRNFLLALCLVHWGMAMAIGEHASDPELNVITDNSARLSHTIGERSSDPELNVITDNPARISKPIGEQASDPELNVITDNSARISTSEPSSLFSFFTLAPKYIAQAINDPHTVWSESRVLPMFWSNGSDDDHSSHFCHSSDVGEFTCGAVAGTSLGIIALGFSTLIGLAAYCLFKKVLSRCGFGNTRHLCSCDYCQSRRRAVILKEKSGPILPMVEPHDGFSKLGSPKIQ